MTERTEHDEVESLNVILNDPEKLAEYKRPYDGYKVSLVPRILGEFLVACGDIIYGEKPSYLKFRSVEVIARVPYHSWASAAYTLLTLFYSNETRALKLSTITAFARFAQDNETMHVVVVSCLARRERWNDPIRQTVIPLLFAFFYFWASYLLYMINPRYSLELNYMFESHAFEQYDRFLKENEHELRHKLVQSDFLTWYGRAPKHQYDFFQSVRNDELIHRNRSIREIELNVGRLRAEDIVQRLP